MTDLKRIVKIGAIIFAVVLLGTPSEVSAKLIPYIAWGIVACLIIFYIYSTYVKKRNAEKFRKYNEHMIRSNKVTGELLAKQFNAPISKTINYAHERYIFISEVESLIMVDGVTFGFEQLLACEFDDDSRVISNTTTRSEKQNTSFLRYMLNSDSGNIVDAVNAPTTSYSSTSSVTYHDYKLKLTLNSLTNPYILIRLGDDDEAKDYLKGVFDVIIHMNQENKAREGGH